jgi:hypothetical protein
MKVFLIIRHNGFLFININAQSILTVCKRVVKKAKWHKKITMKNSSKNLDGKIQIKSLG